MAEAKKKKQPQNWYQRWKKFPYHTQVNWLIFGALAWPAALVFLGALPTDLSPVENGPQGQILGIRTQQANGQPVTSREDSSESEARVLGETTGPMLPPSELEAADIEPNRNSINVTERDLDAEGEVLGQETQATLTPSELEEQGIQRAKNTNK